MRGEEIGTTGTSMLAMENPDTGWVYPRATMKEKRAARASEVWWRAGELNPRPLRCERSALPTELAPHLTDIRPVRRMSHRAAHYTQPFPGSLAGC